MSRVRIWGDMCGRGNIGRYQSFRQCHFLFYMCERQISSNKLIQTDSETCYVVITKGIKVYKEVSVAIVKYTYYNYTINFSSDFPVWFAGWGTWSCSDSQLPSRKIFPSSFFHPNNNFFSYPWSSIKRNSASANSIRLLVIRIIYPMIPYFITFLSLKLSKRINNCFCISS